MSSINLQKFLTGRACLIWMVLVLFITNGCKKENNTPEKKEEEQEQVIYKESLVIGKWIYDKVKLNGTLYNYAHSANCGKDRFYFVNRPGQEYDYTEIVYLSPSSVCATSQTGMDWKIKGKKLLLNFGTQVFTYDILKLNETNFDVAIKLDFDNDGKVDEVELHAIKEACTTGDPYCQIKTD